MNLNNPISDTTTKKIKDEITKKIKPNVSNIFLKIFIIHSSVALITTSLCPQFGVGLKSGIDLSHLFSQFGELSCDLFCGFFFASTSILVAFAILTRDEIRFLSYYRLYLTLIFILISIGLLLMFNTQLFVELTFVWLIGTIIGVLGTFEVGNFILKRNLL